MTAARTQTSVPDDIRQARHRVGAAIRRIGHAFVGHEAPIELLDESAATLDALSDRFSKCTLRSRSHIEDDTWDQEVGDGDVITSYDERPVSGRASPWGLDLTVTRAGDEVEARCTLHAAHEGAPERSHGGVVAALFDDVYGMVLGVMRVPAFTGDLYVRYENPTPLHVELSCRARLVRQERRKLFMTAELVRADDPTETVIARSETTMIAVDPTEFADGTDEVRPPRGVSA